MSRELKPIPNGSIRSEMAEALRREAARVSRSRTTSNTQRNNGEAAACTPAFGTFTKGLRHDRYGCVSTVNLESLIDAINQDSANAEDAFPFPKTYTTKKAAPFEANAYDGGFIWPLKPGLPQEVGWRGWESPLAGHTFDVEGPDADQCAMPPAPKLGSHELVAEMAELYEMALIRDVPFTMWEGNQVVADAAAFLNTLPWFDGSTADGGDVDDGLTSRERDRRAARNLAGGALTWETLFRGSTRGAQTGPYVSQFLLVGNAERESVPLAPPPAHHQERAPAGSSEGDALNRSGRFVPPELLRALRQSGTARLTADGKDPNAPAQPKDGFIQYGGQTIVQRVLPHKEYRDHLTDLASWLDVQNGANRKGRDYYDKTSRFIWTPRDLATYVHFDALYQAYLNACLILLGVMAPSDIGLPEGPGHPTRDGFATFGGPHILTLVTEVATRALKAVRRQKYNVHLRARPEAVAGAITLAWNARRDAVLKSRLGNCAASLEAMVDGLDALLPAISTHNGGQNQMWLAQSSKWPVQMGWIDPDMNALLPMAFPEGSPMHPSYGAGHATVAGACVTVVKAFFEMFELPSDIKRGGTAYDELVRRAPAELFGRELKLTEAGDPDLRIPENYVPVDEGRVLEGVGDALTVQGELDKLAANISIGRDFAGVHYYTDYYESLRMGERVAVGLLQEQMLTYREPITMRFTSFDGDRIMLVGTGGSRGLNDTPVHVWNEKGEGGDEAAFRAWWRRALD